MCGQVEWSLPGWEATVSGEDLIDLHLTYARRRGLSEGTIKNRRLALRRLEKYLPCLAVGATRAHLDAWAQQRPKDGNKGEGLSDGAWRNELVQVREFYQWLIQQDIRTDDPTSRIPVPRLARRYPRPMSDKVIRTALDSCSTEDAVIIALARFAGLRACEIARLSWSDVDLEERQVFVRKGKGGHQREIPVSATLMDYLTALPHRSGPVVRRLDGRTGHCTDNTISRRGSDLLPEGETLHKIRHSFGTATYQQSKDLRTVQDLLGHSSPSTTALYAKARTAAAREAVESAGLSA